MKAIQLVLIGIIIVSGFSILFYKSYMSSEFLAKPQISFEDKNSDGIWDDVESYIEKYASKGAERKALEYKFKSFQNILLNPEVGKEIKKASLGDDELEVVQPVSKDDDSGGMVNVAVTSVDHMARANACIYKVYGLQMQVDLEDIEKAILTSEARVRAYLRYNHHLSGGTYTLWDESRQGDPCLEF